MAITPNERVIVAAKAAEREYFCFVDVDRGLQWRSAINDIANEWIDPDNVLRIYDGQHEPPWMHWRLDRDIVSLCRYRYPDRDREIFVSLSAEGDVGFIGLQEGFTEHIPGAGMRHPDALGYGMMERIRQIGTRLYAIGFCGQVYRREAPGDWRHVDEGILEPPLLENIQVLSDIDGPAEDDIYLVGSEAFLAHYNGAAWRKLDPPTDRDLKEAQRFNAILVEDARSIWIAGKWGVLMHGNAADGFVERSDPQVSAMFTSLARYGGKLYLGTREGLFVREDDRIVPVDTGLAPPLASSRLIEAVDGTLWVFGFGEIVRFDGARWARVARDGAP